MLSKNNTYFKAICDYFYGKKEERPAERPTAGMCKAYRAWLHSVDEKLSEIELDDYLNDGEVKDFVKAICDAGFTSFILTDKSTALMDNLHDLVAAGCTMDGIVTIKKHDVWSDTHTKEVRGIRFTL